MKYKRAQGSTAAYPGPSIRHLARLNLKCSSAQDS